MLFSLFAVLLFCTAASAQKGGILLGGNFGVNTVSHDYIDEIGSGIKLTLTDKTVTGVFSPVLGYGITDNLIIGLEIGVTSIKETEEEYDFILDEINKIEVITTSLNAGPFVRYTKSLGDVFSVYGQGVISIISGKSETKYPGVADKYIEKLSGFGARVFPAVSANIGSGWAINFSFGNLSFTSTKTEPDDKDEKWEHKYSTLDISFNPQANIGVSKTFGGTAK